MKILFSSHARYSMKRRGAKISEVKIAITKGKGRKAKVGRFESSVNFSYKKEWNGVYYETKQVNPVFVKEDDTITVITVYVFYF